MFYEYVSAAIEAMLKALEHSSEVPTPTAHLVRKALIELDVVRKVEYISEGKIRNAKRLGE